MTRANRPSLRACALSALLVVAACSGESSAPATSSEFYFPPDEAASTLLPIIPETLPSPETVVIPPDALFGGDLCDALDTDEVPVERVEYLAVDACQFSLAGTSGDVVRIEVVTGAEFLERPSDANDEDLTGWPETVDVAWSAVVFAGVRVMVRVENGSFGVTAPTLAVARRMARSAAQWVGGGAPTEVDADPVDETVPTDTAPPESGTPSTGSSEPVSGETVPTDTVTSTT
ncbi:MAG: hypothetical protein ACO3AV_08090 [Ilumatobacteraceae bacterium]